MQRNRRDIYEAIVKKVKENLTKVHENLVYSGAVNKEWIKNQISRKANISAVQNTNYFFYNQDKLKEFLNEDV